jgi:ankyrin repeat protein
MIDGLTDLHVALLGAVDANDLPAAAELLKKGADVNRRGPTAYTPLMVAAGRGLVQMTDLLLQARADVHVHDSSLGATALHRAAQSGVVDVARLLLDHGAFINFQSATVGHTPLIDAVWSKRVAMVQFLLERGAALTIKGHHQATVWDFIGKEPIWTAGFTAPETEAWGKQIRSLLEEHQGKADRAVAGQTLMQAVAKNDGEGVRRAIGAGADVNEKSPVVGGGNDGQTPLLVASFLGHAEIVRVLLAAGANPRIVDYLLKATPAHKAAYAGRSEALRALIEHGGVELDAQGPYNGYTALHDGVWHGHSEIVKLLLSAGVRTDLRGFDGNTPADLARVLGYREIEALIREKSPAPKGAR